MSVMMSMSDREKARDLGNQAARLSRGVADLLNDALDALERAESDSAKQEAVIEAARAFLREDVGHNVTWQYESSYVEALHNALTALEVPA